MATIILGILVVFLTVVDTLPAKDFYDANGSGIGVKVWKTTNTNYSLALLIDLKGQAISNAWSIKRLQVVEALDDAGNNLRTNGVPPKNYAYKFFQYAPHDELRTSLCFRDLPQATKVIKKVVLEVDLICPTKENHGLIVISNFLRNAGAPLWHSGLTNFGLNVTCFDQKAFEAKTNEIFSAKAHGKRFEQGTLNYIFDKALVTPFGSSFCYNSEDAVRFIIQDPEKKFCAFEFRDSKHPNDSSAVGSVQAIGSQSAEWWSYCFGKQPSDDWQMTLFLDAPLATSTKTIVLENISVH